MVESPTSSDVVDALSAELLAIVETALTSRQYLYTASAQDTVTMSPEDLHERLLTSRKVVDALEFQLVKALMAKSRADRLKAQCSADVEDAEIAVSPTSTDDFAYLSGRQRDIDINGKTIVARRAFRRSATLASDAYYLVEEVKTLHRGADSYRREVDTRLRAVSLTTALER